MLDVLSRFVNMGIWLIAVALVVVSLSLAANLVMDPAYKVSGDIAEMAASAGDKAVATVANSPTPMDVQAVYMLFYKNRRDLEIDRLEYTDIDGNTHGPYSLEEFKINVLLNDERAIYPVEVDATQKNNGHYNVNVKVSEVTSEKHLIKNP